MAYFTSASSSRPFAYPLVSEKSEVFSFSVAKSCKRICIPLSQIKQLFLHGMAFLQGLYGQGKSRRKGSFPFRLEKVRATWNGQGGIAFFYCRSWMYLIFQFACKVFLLLSHTFNFVS